MLPAFLLTDKYIFYSPVEKLMLNHVFQCIFLFVYHTFFQ